ncbi:MAG: hypothetical protein IJS50_00705 [Desulfovibrio sp.]|nr:hypothetical protein [Desulfovibrio sp.]
MLQKQFIDGFSQVHFVGGLVRINLYQLEPVPNAEPKEEEVAQLIMTPQAFVESFNAMQQLAEKLAEAGILQRS